MIFYIYYLVEETKAGEKFHQYKLWSSCGFSNDVDMWIFFQNFTQATLMGDCLDVAGNWYRKFISMPQYADQFPLPTYSKEVGEVTEDIPF
jgi:hypothetical protein